MRGLLCIALCWLFISNTYATEPQPILYIFAPSPATDTYQRQMQSLRNAQTGLEKRGVMIRAVFATGVVRTMDSHLVENRYAQQLYDTYTVLPTKFTLLLIDKNGEVRLRLLRPLPAEGIFVYLDTYPLREKKLRFKKNGKV